MGAALDSYCLGKASDFWGSVVLVSGFSVATDLSDRLTDS